MSHLPVGGIYVLSVPASKNGGNLRIEIDLRRWSLIRKETQYVKTTDCLFGGKTHQICRQETSPLQIDRKICQSTNSASCYFQIEATTRIIAPEIYSYQNTTSRKRTANRQTSQNGPQASLPGRVRRNLNIQAALSECPKGSLTKCKLVIICHNKTNPGKSFIYLDY